MSKHTKGPWDVDRNNVHSGQIATIHGCTDNTWVEVWSPEACCASEKEMEANASLIAAAPELLEKLKAAIEIFEWLKMDNYIRGYLSCEDERIARIAESVAKATGSQP